MPRKIFFGQACQNKGHLRPLLQLLHPQKTAMQIDRELEDSAGVAWWMLDEHEGRKIACCVATRAYDFLEITDLFVVQALRRRGIAAALLRAVVARGRAWGMAEVGLEVRASNFCARALYLHQGFVQSRIRKNYYANPSEDALVLQKCLEPESN